MTGSGRPQRCWLFKSEPGAYSIDDLAREKDRTTSWEGVRSYEARNLLRDEVGRGDRVLFYHSSCKVPAVAGTCRVVRAGYPDPTQFDPASSYHDPKADPDDPRWFMVDIALERKFATPVPLAELRAIPDLAGMPLLRRGQRLSIQPLRPEHWRIITRLGRRKTV